MLKSYKTVVLILLIFLIAIKKISCLNFPKISFSNSNNAINLKVKILELAKKTNRGLTETPNDKETMNKLFESLEKLNRNKKTLSNPSLNAIWSLEYTTSDSILGRGGPERFGPILQTINTNDLKAENAEVINYFGFLKIQRYFVHNIIMKYSYLMILILTISMITYYDK